MTVAHVGINRQFNGYLCFWKNRHATDWAEIKARWDLTITDPEAKAVAEIPETCEDPPEVGEPSTRRRQSSVSLKTRTIGKANPTEGEEKAEVVVQILETCERTAGDGDPDDNYRDTEARAKGSGVRGEGRGVPEGDGPQRPGLGRRWRGLRGIKPVRTAVEKGEQLESGGTPLT